MWNFSLSLFHFFTFEDIEGYLMESRKSSLAFQQSPNFDVKNKWCKN